MKVLLIPFLWYLFLIQDAFADSERPPKPIFTSSHSGWHVFKMIPNGLGVCYRIEQDGEFVEIWRTEGWYSSNVFLSNNGKYLVRMGPWNDGCCPEKTI